MNEIRSHTVSAAPGVDRVRNQSDANAERRLGARLGAVLFRNRSWMPLPMVAIALAVPGHMAIWRWIVGAILIAIGEGVRVCGVAAAGAVTRRRSRDVQRLVTYGIFARVRNPLYVGNFVIWIGFVVISGITWLLPAAVLFFAIQYTLIVEYEEAVLLTIFGQEYRDYRQRTRRWIPRLGAASEKGPHDWAEAWRAERSTLWQYVALTAIFLMKERVWHV